MMNTPDPDRAPDAPAATDPSETRILVAEDDLVNQKVAVLQLGRFGYEADLVTDGTEVLAALEKVPYDLILMDCQMPRMDGLETARRIRELHDRTIRIVAMTASAIDGDRQLCLDAGMDDFLTKPVRLDDIGRVLEKWARPPALAAQAHKEEPPVDVERLIEVTGQSREMFRKISVDYLEQADEIVVMMVQALRAGNEQELRWLAHKLGGSSASCGIQSIVPLLAELEHLKDFDMETARDLVDRTNRQLIDVRRFLLRYSETLNG